MQWRKLGLVYAPDGRLWWAKTHAMIPTPVVLNDSVVRVYVTSCDVNGVGRVGFVDVDARDPTRVLYVGQSPVLDIGQEGTFDENGVLVCSVVDVGAQRYMYYAGFELGTKIRYRLLTGLAIQDEGAMEFRRVQRVPVLERSETELYFRGGPFVLYENGRFRMWYVAGSRWENVGGVPKPVYEIHYAESLDGIHWPQKGIPCIRIMHANEHGFGRPYVVRRGGVYQMFYSIRRRDLQSYRVGYAESQDGIHWERKDDLLNFDVSPEGWDSAMVCYTAVIDLHGCTYMFYNGNDFGRTGFGVAVLEAW